MPTTCFEILHGLSVEKSCARRISVFFNWSHMIVNLVLISSTFYAHIFCTEVLKAAFFYLHVTREKLPKKLLYEKFARKTLMKLTLGETQT